ncbi:hypothetical protein GCM10009807_08120 [Microbacterium lacus]|uniref:Polysaccharide pyruvyl transferase domain-containing protein n=2 Tax=Microbacterium lacus TaxID=415217 RepID=A0ABN2G721_9MICO
MGKPIYLWTQSAGPFKDARARALIERLTPQLDGIFFRDERSRAAWSSISALPSSESVAPDCVFGLHDGSAQVPLQRDADSPLALISVRSWGQGAEGGQLDFTAYRAAMRRIAVNLMSQGWRCVAVSTCQGVAGYNVDDANTARSIFDGLDVAIDSDFHTPDQLVQRIRSAQLVVATRMHLAILSLISQTPVIAIAYEPKSLELFRSLGRGDAVIEIEKTSENWADSLFVDGDVISHAAKLSLTELEALSERARIPARLIRDRLHARIG